MSRGLVGLWDLVHFSVRSFLFAVDLIDQEAGLCALTARQDSNAKFPPEWDERFQKNMNFIIEKCDEIQCDSGRDMVARIVDMARQRMPVVVINNHLHALRGQIEDDVNRRTFSYIPLSERSLLIQLPGTWSEIWKRFPGTEADARAATEAYAHGLYVACVFHSMLVLEYGLFALAARLKIKRGVKEWGRIIENVQTAISKFGAARSHTPKGAKPPSSRTAARNAKFHTFLAETAKEFTYFKDAWRNHVAHGRALYDRHDAAKVLDHVREFMTILSGQLKQVNSK